MAWIAAALVPLAAGCAPLSHPAGEAQPPRAASGPPPVDALVEATWRAAGIVPAPPASDGEFLRRLTLDLAGRIPTLPEARAFLGDRSPDKRARAVDRLLASDEFAEHWGGGIYADLLFGDEDKAAKLERRYDPAAWLVQAFAENRPYDQLATQLITASGDLRDNGAVAFIGSRARGGGGPEAVAGATARIFLGLQIQCAQCHDHPYDPRWHQEDFYGLVAFFARTKAKNEKSGKEKSGNAEAAPAMAMAPDAEMAAPGKAKPDKTLVLLEAPRGEAKMRRPHTETDVTVRPRFLGRELTARPGDTRRRTVARAIVASDLFPKAMVSRTWAQLLGHGVMDPWDDLGAEDDPRHPPLLRALAEQFVASRYDIKALIRTIVLSSAYGRSASGGTGDQAVRLFARSGVRPLPPEPLFRSLLVATGAAAMTPRKGGEDCPEVERSLHRPRRAPADTECAPARRLRQSFREYQFVFGDDEMAEADRFDGSVPQSLLLWNGELTNRGARGDSGGVLGQILAANHDPAARLDDMFLAVYTRPPSSDERQRLLGFLREQGNGRPAYEDLFFALVTSTEAITNH
jgi:hypothetical protein